MTYSIHPVSHNRFSHIVIARDEQFEKVISELTYEVVDGKLLLDMKSSTMPAQTRFWVIEIKGGHAHWRKNKPTRHNKENL